MSRLLVADLKATDKHDNMKTAITLSMLVACIVTNTYPRWVHPITIDDYCKWQALSFVFLAIAALTKGNSNIGRIAFQYVVLLAGGNAMDEIFGIATETSIYELIWATIVTLWMIYKVRVCYTKKG